MDIPPYERYDVQKAHYRNILATSTNKEERELAEKYLKEKDDE